MRTGEDFDFAAHDGLQVEGVDHLRQNLLLVLGGEDGLDGALDGARDVVDVLRLDDRADVVLQHLGEVVLQLAAAEVRENVRPGRLVFEIPEVWLQLPRQNLQRRRLPSLPSL